MWNLGEIFGVKAHRRSCTAKDGNQIKCTELNSLRKSNWIWWKNGIWFILYTKLCFWCCTESWNLESWTFLCGKMSSGARPDISTHLWRWLLELLGWEMSGMLLAILHSTLKLFWNFQGSPVQFYEIRMLGTGHCWKFNPKIVEMGEKERPIFFKLKLYITHKT